MRNLSDFEIGELYEKAHCYKCETIRKRELGNYCENHMPKKRNKVKPDALCIKKYFEKRGRRVVLKKRPNLTFLGFLRRLVFY